MDALVSLSKRRGFVFQSSEIYGGTGSVWDYGPLGVELKNNVKRLWWRDVVHRRDDMVGLDAGILMHPKTWEASGHISHFADPLVDCKKCKTRFRFDDLVGDETVAGEAGGLKVRALNQVLVVPSCATAVALLELEAGQGATQPDPLLVVAGKKIPSGPKPEKLAWKGRPTLGHGEAARTGAYFAFFPIEKDLKMDGGLLTVGVASLPVGLYKFVCKRCGDGELTEPRQFNLMFKTFMGPVEEEASVAYLRPETAQGIFVNFANVLNSSRKKLPFGIAQIGKAFRNEITPGNFIFRTREFEQMEIEYFVRPGTDEELHQRWIDDRLAWYRRYGIKPDSLSVYEHPKEKLSHYSKRTVDIMFKFPIGVSELEGIANRTDFDLKQHSQFSGQPLSYFDEETKQHLTPFVIEPSAGVDRNFLAFLTDAYEEQEVRGEKRVVLHFHPELAPVKIAVLPLLKKREDIVKSATGLTAELRKRFVTVYDDSASIGRLYRRQDEVGTPICVTVDVETVEKDQWVTIRERDSMDQIRVPLARAADVCGEILQGGWGKVSGEFGVWKKGE